MVAQQIDDASEFSVDASAHWSSPQGPIMLTRWRSALIITLAHVATALGGRVLFDYVEFTRGYDDERNVQATYAFAVIMGISWLISMVLLMRRSASDATAEPIR